MKLYKIGELSNIAGVSSRTIDYYTKIGLLHPIKRLEKSNYRLYNDETLDRLKRIEELKKEKYTLEEIKEKLDQLDKITEDKLIKEKLTLLQDHLKLVEKDVKELSPVIENLKPNQAKSIYQHLTPQTAACMEALLFLLNKGPLM
ncbi:MerR family transcriptional regulator [Chengkuizengella axinellae]|uniref:MerR family transcriptional regulator n=1 Tax=Chengkuizengella axinellae TaxID=3064388 RepID=A0ABT9IZI7_9BACL|nr:MerR family transcriptional regulator [Chengkuizengella sp. 2205SS18-9]MDP5274547.1 MerR family transcriptional regulator [Chengkuizengella sp. 2205SS18-9]